MKTKLIKITDSSYKLSGDLSFATVAAIYNNNYAVISDLKETTEIDLSEVNYVDSSALALLISWLRIAHKHQQQLVFKNLPSALLSLASLSAVDTLLQGSG